MSKKILLHVCCGICALGAIEKLKSRGFSVFGYFYNPNIYLYAEYLRRRRTIKKFNNFYQIEFLKSDYNPDDWQKKCGKLRREKEGGKRCSLCFRLRLKQTQEIAVTNNFDYFTTTLTLSPHKNSQKIFEIGEEIGKGKFLKIDFKKEEGFKKTLSKAKKLNLYRQNYCGCIYSLVEKIQKQAQKTNHSSNNAIK